MDIKKESWKLKKSKQKERVLEEHNVNEPVYDEGISGYSVTSMRIIYEEQGIDLANRDKQLESV